MIILILVRFSKWNSSHKIKDETSGVHSWNSNQTGQSLVNEEEELMDDVDPIERNQILVESQTEISPVPAKRFSWSSVGVDSLAERSESVEPVVVCRDNCGSNSLLV